MSNIKYMSGAEFRLYFEPLLAQLKDDDQVTFGNGDLSFVRPKNCGPVQGAQTYNIQFGQTYTVTSDGDFP